MGYSASAIWDFFSIYISSLLGDVNDDGLINILDIIESVNIILGIENYNSMADVNSDGIINVLDIIMLVNLILE